MYDYYFYNLISKKVYKEIFLITPIIKTPKLNIKISYTKGIGLFKQNKP